MAQPYKPLQHLPNDKIQRKLREDVLYWRRMKQLAIFQEPGNITSVSFSTAVEDYVASTSSIRLSVFDVSVCELITSCSRFREAIYGVAFRKDGKLLAVGSQDGRARIFDAFRHGAVGKKAPLRSYKSHTCPVHTVSFTASGKSLIVSGDDGTVKVFDIMETRALPLKVINAAHSDHIRCSDSSKTSDHLFVTGSYDHTAKVWNLNAKENELLVTVDHSMPIESVLFIPGDCLLATAGGQFIKIWSLIDGGKLLHTLHNHHKTVTGICLASKGTRLLSGGLDKRINVYRLNTGDFSLVHAFTMPAPVYALSVSINDNYMAVGMGNLLGIFRREAPGTLETTVVGATAVGEGLEHKRSISTAAGTMKQQERGGIAEEIEITAPSMAKLHGGRINDLLRKYKHWKAVDVLFRNPHYVASNPDVIVAAFREIYDRRALRVALAGRNIETLRPLILFLCRYLFRPHYFAVLFAVTKTLLGVYVEEELDLKVVRLLQKLEDAVGREISLQKSLYQACGALEVLFSASAKQQDSLQKNGEIFGDVAISPIPFAAAGEIKTT